jgi:hypothetical protein
MRIEALPMMAIAALVFAGSCGTSQLPAQERIPTDGVHITGAIQGVYPIGSGATCGLATVNTDKILQFSPNAKSGAVIGLELIKYEGAATYSPLDWPPYEHSALWVGLIGGHTWRAHSGRVTVTSADSAKVSGTLAASGMQQVDGTTTVNATGSWTCRLVWRT